LYTEEKINCIKIDQNTETSQTFEIIYAQMGKSFKKKPAVFEIVSIEFSKKSKALFFSELQ